MTIRDHLRALLTASDEWCVGRTWAPRALVLGWLAWTLGRLFVGGGCTAPFMGIDMGIHEGGHLLTHGLGRVLCAAAGSGAQCAAPVIAAVLFARQPDWFGVAFAGCWLSVNLIEVARYCADATAMQLPLVTVGGGTFAREDTHDWHFILDSLGMLGAEAWLAPLMWLVALAIAIASLAFGARLCWRMAHAAPAQPS